MGEAAPEGLTTVPHAELVSKKGVYVVFLPSPNNVCKSACQTKELSCVVLCRVQDSWGEIAGLLIPQDLLNDILPTFSSN